MDMDFNLADKASRVAIRHIRKGTPIEKAWPEVVAAARRGLGPKLAKSALDLPITQGLTAVAAEFAALLGRDQPGKKIKGLWFGLVELSRDERIGHTVWTPYLAGAARFSTKDEQWPVGPAWMPPDCYAPNQAMTKLSDLRRRYKKQHWTIETTLIEPLNTLFAGAIAASFPPPILLCTVPSRGIGCGFDSGDFRTLGIVDKTGFKPAKAR